jgi:hypothetical protein
VLGNHFKNGAEHADAASTQIDRRCQTLGQRLRETLNKAWVRDGLTGEA